MGGISIERLGERRYSISGELDIASTPMLDALIDQEGLAPGDDVVLELADLSFIDSQGVRALIGLAASLLPDGRLLVRGTTTSVGKVFSLIRLQDIANIDVSEADRP